MANECEVFEQILPRSPRAAIKVVPFLARQTLSTTDSSAAFNKSTKMVTIKSSLAGRVEFSRIVNGVLTHPDGTGITYPIAANAPEDFDVQPGHKVRFV